mmetsp:Transcript_29392/g.43375  ORF Transcript_29392/g.43375 Transcript_29392/m.43375 type:complete len:92 (+) Transcript_29392:525-800(+)
MDKNMQEREEIFQRSSEKTSPERKRTKEDEADDAYQRGILEEVIWVHPLLDIVLPSVDNHYSMPQENVTPEGKVAFKDDGYAQSNHAKMLE